MLCLRLLNLPVGEQGQAGTGTSSSTGLQKDWQACHVQESATTQEDGAGAGRE